MLSSCVSLSDGSVEASRFCMFQTQTLCEGSDDITGSVASNMEDVQIRQIYKDVPTSDKNTLCLRLYVLHVSSQKQFLEICSDHLISSPPTRHLINDLDLYRLECRTSVFRFNIFSCFSVCQIQNESTFK